MRRIAHIILLLGATVVAFAAYDEHTGVTMISGPGAYSTPVIVKRLENPRDFHNAMIYHWIECSLTIIGGLVLKAMCDHADTLDPLSTDFAGKKEIDELERTLDEEQERRRRPLK